MGHGETEQGLRKWEYFSVLEEHFAGDPSVQPTLVISSTPAFTPPPPPPSQETPSSSTSATIITPATPAETTVSKSTTTRNVVTPKKQKKTQNAYEADKLDEIIKLQKETNAFQKERNEILLQFTVAITFLSAMSSDEYCMYQYFNLFQLFR